MPEYLSPGVYIEEIEMGAKPIEGVSTSTAGFLGETARGSTKPTLVTSWLEYQRKFGSYFGANKYLPYAVEGFFRNGGQRCYIGRIVQSTATSASTKLLADDNAAALTVTAVGEGSWGNRIAVKVTKDTDAFRLVVFYWKNQKDIPSSDPEADTTTLQRASIEIYEKVSLDDSSPNYYEKKVNAISNIVRLSKEKGDSGKVPSNWIQFLEHGIDGVEHEDTAKKLSTNPDSRIDLGTNASTENDYYKNMEIKIVDGKGKDQTRTITAYDGTSKIATVDENWTTNPDNTSKYRIYNPKLTVSDYTRKDINTPGEKKGLTAFEEVDQISIVYSPNSESVKDLTKVLIDHCELLKDRFAIIDEREAPSTRPYDTKYAALYYPWINVVDPETGLLRLIPLGGHIAGIYARSDVERGVHKAPANEIVRGADSTEFAVTKGQQDILNPIGINCIRAFPGRGIRVWGARTLSSDATWKYVNVRRLFLFLEESIEEGTQWVVFEPNDEKLWARVKQTISQFLTRVWKDGALIGNTPEEAFFVKCDRTTMTQDEIDNGKLIVLIGVAPVKPAEFVIFRIAQWAGGSSTSE